MLKRYRAAKEEDLSYLNQLTRQLPGEYPEMRPGSMICDKDGEWVKWEDVEALARKAFNLSIESGDMANEARILSDRVSDTLVMLVE